MCFVAFFGFFLMCACWCYDVLLNCCGGGGSEFYCCSQIEHGDLAVVLD
jgi:hypothetical protein